MDPPRPAHPRLYPDRLPPIREVPDGCNPVCSLAVWRDSQLVIFDCDGVLVDSEVISNRVLAEMLSAEGLPTTLAQARRDYQGLLLADVLSRAQEKLGRILPRD
jgi:hypothetical protein